MRRYGHVIAAVVLVAAVARSHGALSATTVVGLAVGAAWLLWLSRRPTRLVRRVPTTEEQLLLLHRDDE
jgi:hypothetical protein